MQNKGLYHKIISGNMRYIVDIIGNILRQIEVFEAGHINLFNGVVD